MLLIYSYLAFTWHTFVYADSHGKNGNREFELFRVIRRSTRQIPEDVSSSIVLERFYTIVLMVMSLRVLDQVSCVTCESVWA